jgi:hypothetical protein
VSPTFKAAVALMLALFFAVPASAQSATHFVTQVPNVAVHALSPPPAPGGFVHDSGALIAQGQGLGKNPPAPVRQPGARTRLITAIAFVGGVAGLVLLFCGHGGGR